MDSSIRRPERHVKSVASKTHRAMREHSVTAICRRDKLEHIAPRHNSERIAVLINEDSQDFRRRSSPVCAKNALASFNISWARASPLTSCSGFFIHRASLDVKPTRVPATISVCSVHLFKVCGTQTTLKAMNSMAAHSGEYRLRCSGTILSARSSSSGKNLSVFFRAQSSRSTEPLQNRVDSIN